MFDQIAVPPPVLLAMNPHRYHRHYCVLWLMLLIISLLPLTNYYSIANGFADAAKVDVSPVRHDEKSIISNRNREKKASLFHSPGRDRIDYKLPDYYHHWDDASTTTNIIDATSSIDNLPRDDARSNIFSSKSPYCVRSASEIQRAVSAAITTGSKYTRIDICVKSLNLLRPLDVKNKRIQFFCQDATSSQSSCTINGRKKMRFITGANADIVINRINFMNGYSKLLGIGSIQLYDSNLTMNRVLFRDNKFPKGSLVSSNVSTTAKQSETSIKLNNIRLERNTASDLLYFTNSKVMLYNITIRNNINSTAINANNNSDVKVSSATIYDNIGLDYFLIQLTDVSTIGLQMSRYDVII